MEPGHGEIHLRMVERDERERTRPDDPDGGIERFGTGQMQ